MIGPSKPSKAVKIIRETNFVPAQIRRKVTNVVTALKKNMSAALRKQKFYERVEHEIDSLKSEKFPNGIRAYADAHICEFNESELAVTTMQFDFQGTVFDFKAAPELTCSEAKRKIYIAYHLQSKMVDLEVAKKQLDDLKEKTAFRQFNPTLRFV